ncbi:MAG: single-stranded DNA-binding protein [Patescibacteria group bacterium]|nr:single-stranded DNA-binding protein [Patescibacteria group bacterium]MBU1160504.1 single-stranded DNA-binding protein [Patescibacteria group bacterium]MBU1421416.1 single-stranded DNA-binding protein [Patescibacteria group bacterium]MBU1987747.1 single-stranded DNA-binding protein [Patescibacteria group bacterium]MBU2416142.1 single-stranded DNA-binding protein [Patescibacteria group bacterium]
MNLNKAMIIGNLTRDPEVKTIPSGQTVASFGVATNFVWTDQSGQRQERVEFHNIVAWKKLAEICGQYLHKGRKVYIEGRMQTRNWVDQNEVKHYRTEIVADNMIILDRPSDRANTGNSAGNNFAGAGQTNQTPQGQSSVVDEPPVIDVEQPVQLNRDDNQNGDNFNEEEIKVEDIPF